MASLAVMPVTSVVKATCMPCASELSREELEKEWVLPGAKLEGTNNKPTITPQISQILREIILHSLSTSKLCILKEFDRKTQLAFHFPLLIKDKQF
eukprot:c49499_g1_i1 orf=167-454(+)